MCSVKCSQCQDKQKMASKLYEVAASVLERARKKDGSVKSLCFSSDFRNKKQLVALVLETVKYYKVLEKVNAHCYHVWLSNVQIGTSLKLVLLYETVFGRGIPINYKYHDLFHKNKELFLKTLADINLSHPSIIESQHKKAVKLPRYVRINTIKISTVEAIDAFINDGYKHVDLKIFGELSTGEFTSDGDIENLLVFSSAVDLHENVLYKQGKIFLQDKASCLPAFILNPPPQSFIIDACAAPGNKSSHLACITNNSGNIYSFDLDKSRLQVMKKLLYKAGATCVQTKHRDFLKVKHTDDVFSKVEYILLDPSCSGSGIVSRMDDLLDEEVTDVIQEKRLKGLSGFQTAALSHALTFPHVKKVVYSTCSIHKEENENVIEKACKRFSSSFRLVNIMPSWKNRGIGGWEEAHKCIRAVPNDDFTNGFFVAMFKRIGPTILPNKNGQSVVANDCLNRVITDTSSKNEIVFTSKKEKKGTKKRERVTEAEFDHEVAPKRPFAVQYSSTKKKGTKKKEKEMEPEPEPEIDHEVAPKRPFAVQNSSTKKKGTKKKEKETEPEPEIDHEVASKRPFAVQNSSTKKKGTKKKEKETEPEPEIGHKVAPKRPFAVQNSSKKKKRGRGKQLKKPVTLS